MVPFHVYEEALYSYTCVFPFTQRKCGLKTDSWIQCCAGAPGDLDKRFWLSSGGIACLDQFKMEWEEN